MLVDSWAFRSGDRGQEKGLSVERNSLSGRSTRIIASSRPHRFLVTAVLLFWASLVFLPAGCLPQKMAATPSRLASRLRPGPLPAGPNGLFMDVIHLERPLGDPDLNTSLWATADEEPLAIALREKLAVHGFRVAILGGSLPPILKTLFNEEEIGQMNGEHLQLQQAIPTLVQTGGADAIWPKELVEPRSRESVVSGRGPDRLSDQRPGAGSDQRADAALDRGVDTEPVGADADKSGNFVNAQGFLRVTPRITSDGCVDLAVLPEIQYGEERKSFVPSLGANGPLDWSIRVGRQSRALEDLSFTLRLRSGQYGLIGCLPLDRDSLGVRFFSRQKNGQTMQRVVLISVEPSHEALAARSIHP